MLNIDAEFNELLLIFRPNPRGIGAIGEFGEFGMALGEISSVEREIHAQWRGVVKAGLGELADIQQDIEASKKIISSSLDIGGKIEALKQRISRLQSKLSKVKNPAAAAKIQEKINAAQPQLNIAQGAYNAMQAAISIAKDVLAKAGIVVEEAKKAVVETATAAKEKAMQAAQKAKEVALAVGAKVKAAAGAAAEAAKVAAAKVKAAAGAAAEAAKQKVSQAAAAVKAAAAQVAVRARATAEAARAVAAQKAAQARAMAQAAAQRVQQAVTQARAQAAAAAQQAQTRAIQVAQQARQAVAQRAAQVTQTARSVAAPVVQRAQQAASAVKSWFGFRGLGELGLDPVTGLIAVGSAVAIAQAALAAANMFTGQGEAVPTDKVTIPETIPLKDIEKYKDIASECYNSAVAQGYVVDTPEKAALLEKTCRERAAAQYQQQVAAQIPYTGEPPGLIDEFEPSLPQAFIPTAEMTPLEQMCAQYPTHPQCAKVTQLPTGGGYYTVGAEPTVMTAEEYYAQQQALEPTRKRIITRPSVEPGVFDEFETLVPGIAPVTGYPPGMPTRVQIPGVTPSYEPGMAPTYAPGVEFPEEGCPDIPDIIDEEYCAQFPQCCEDTGCPDIPEMTDSEYCTQYPECCEETGTSKEGQSLWDMEFE